MSIVLYLLVRTACYLFVLTSIAIQIAGTQISRPTESVRFRREVSPLRGRSAEFHLSASRLHAEFFRQRWRQVFHFASHQGH